MNRIKEVLDKNGIKQTWLAEQFGNSFFDIVFTITVLQHNTNEASLIKIFDELCRVSIDKIIISERVEKTVKGDELCLGRPVEYYSKLFGKNGFQLIEVKNLNLQASYYICGAIRKLFNPKSRKEGEPLTKFSILLENLLLPLTKLFDKIVPSNRDLTYLIYQKKKH